jgi:hypothetical protein
VLTLLLAPLDDESLKEGATHAGNADRNSDLLSF